MIVADGQAQRRSERSNTAHLDVVPVLRVQGSTSGDVMHSARSDLLARVQAPAHAAWCARLRGAIGRAPERWPHFLMLCRVIHGRSRASRRPWSRIPGARIGTVLSKHTVMPHCALLVGQNVTQSPRECRPGS
jgi:hypothetical protein